MEGLDPGRAPTIPLPILLVLTVVFGAVLLLAVRRSGSLPGCFLLVSIWLRVMSGAYHPITFAPLAGGLSINALLSVATVAIGVLVISKRTFSQIWVMPIYALILVILISAVLNRSTSGAIDMFFKWGYVIVLTAAAREAMVKAGPNRILTLIAYCYAPIFVLQAVSVVLGIGKDTEGANALSYIGGYNHEAAFSIMIVTFMLAIYFNMGMSFAVKVGLILLGVAGIMLANYRTAIVSILPLLVGAFMFEGVARFDKRSRGFIIVLAVPVALILAVVMGNALAERFADLGTLITDSERFIKPPREYLADDQKLLSGRLYIWANYIYGFLNGTDLQLIFGFGPNSWVGTFVKYAHNTLVGYLYELGIAGVVALLTVWGTFIAATFRIEAPLTRNKALLAQLGFILFNLATMPHWNIEGNILFAVLQGTMLYYLAPIRRPAGMSTLRAAE